MDDIKFKAGNGSTWIQERGAGYAPGYLPCHGVGDTTAPEGDLTLTYCRSDAEPNKFIVDGSYRGEPGARTTTITSNIYKTQTFLERVKGCPVNLFVHLVECGRMDLFTNYARSFIYHRAVITNRGLSPLAAMDPSAQGPITRTFDVSAENIFEIFTPEARRVSVSLSEALNAIALYGYADCDNPCVDACEALVVAGDSTSGSPSDEGIVALSSDEGSTWAQSATSPFAAAENVAAVGTMQLGANTKRILVARGTTDAGNPAEVAYSDDDGATWTTVDVGSVDGQYAYGPHSLFVLDYYNIWLATTGGYIYYSSDGGATWEAQESGVLSAGIYRAISFSSKSNGYAVVGASGIVVRTIDGGETWSATTVVTDTPALNDVAVLDKNRALVATATGLIYQTFDGGTTWVARSFSGSGAGSVTSLEAYNELILYATHNTAGNVGRILRSIDGGVSWELISMPASTASLNSIVVCDANNAFAVGELAGGTATILKVGP